MRRAFMGGSPKEEKKQNFDKNNYTIYPVEIYRNWCGRYRWRVTAVNGRIIGASSQSYRRKDDCIHNVLSLGSSLVRYTPRNA